MPRDQALLRIGPTNLRKTMCSSLKAWVARHWLCYTHYIWQRIGDCVRPCLYGEKLSQLKGSPSYPSYPGRTNSSYISLQTLTTHLHEEQKVGSARRVACLAGSPSFDGRATFLAGPTFLHINTLACPAGSTWSRWDDKSMRSQLLAQAKGSTFFSYKHLLKLTRLGGWPSCPGQCFSI